MSATCPGEKFEYVNDFLQQQKLRGVTGVPEMIPVTPKMLEDLGWSTTDDYADCALTGSELAEKSLLPLHNKLRLYDQTPSIDAFQSVSETSSLTELKSAQAIFTSSHDEFEQARYAWVVMSNKTGLGPGKIFLDVSCGKGGYDKLTRFWNRAIDDGATVGRLGEAIKKAEKAESDKAEREKADKEQADKEQADKEQADKEQADKEQADKEQADKDKADKDKADKDKAEKDKHDKVVLTKEQVYITFSTKASGAVLLLKSHIDDTDHSTSIKAGEGGVVTATGRDGNPTSNPVALFVQDGGQYVITGGLSFQGDGSGHIVSADTGNSHLTVTRGEDAQHFSIEWDGETQGSSD